MKTAPDARAASGRSGCSEVAYTRLRCRVFRRFGRFLRSESGNRQIGCASEAFRNCRPGQAPGQTGTVPELPTDCPPHLAGTAPLTSSPGWERIRRQARAIQAPARKGLRRLSKKFELFSGKHLSDALPAARQVAGGRPCVSSERKEARWRGSSRR